MTAAELSKLAEGGTVFALLDACDEPLIPIRCEKMGPARAVSLYRGDAEKKFASIAPYLAHLKPEDVDWIAANLWSSPWGYFVIAMTDMATLRTHFRRFLEVILPEQGRVFFRFYDPRVLRTYLASSTPQSIREFFGPAKSLALVVSATTDVIEFIDAP